MNGRRERRKGERGRDGGKVEQVAIINYLPVRLGRELHFIP